MAKLSLNAQLVSDIFAEVAKGNGGGFGRRLLSASLLHREDDQCDDDS